MRSLYARLAVALLVLLALVGAVTLWLTLRTSQLYQDEVQQKLNQPLAGKVVDKYRLVEDGGLREDAAVEIFEDLMLVNPDLEVYLLDTAGNVRAFSAPPGRVQRSRVAVEPIESFLEGAAPLPLYGDDPRDPEGQKIFSAAPVHDADRHLGYLYMVLASEQAESAGQMLAASYILRTSAWIAAGVALLALAGGLAAFWRITRRVRLLSRDVAGFEREMVDLGPAEPVDEPGASAEENRGDELDRLRRTLHRMAATLRRQVGRLEDNDRKRRELIANVSHDVRTPLTHLQGYLETLLMKEDSLTREERREYLEIAAQQSARLGRLVNDLFELAKLDGLERPPRLEVFPIAELVQDVVQEFRLGANGEGGDLEVDIDGDPGTVTADLGVLERVLQNLLENAVEHTGPGDRIVVSLRPAGDAVRVEVADTGPGIPADELPRIFDRFYRCARRNGDDGDGSGLGLSIARRALQLHGAELQCESEPGDGTLFWFELPRRAPATA